MQVKSIQTLVVVASSAVIPFILEGCKSSEKSKCVEGGLEIKCDGKSFLCDKETGKCKHEETEDKVEDVCGYSVKKTNEGIWKVSPEDGKELKKIEKLFVKKQSLIFNVNKGDKAVEIDSLTVEQNMLVMYADDAAILKVKDGKVSDGKEESLWANSKAKADGDKVRFEVTGNFKPEKLTIIEMEEDGKKAKAPEKNVDNWKILWRAAGQPVTGNTTPEAQSGGKSGKGNDAGKAKANAGGKKGKQQAKLAAK